MGCMLVLVRYEDCNSHVSRMGKRTNEENTNVKNL
jgi:hypothetical protein